jgi:hypothetical protein
MGRVLKIDENKISKGQLAEYKGEGSFFVLFRDTFLSLTTYTDTEGVWFLYGSIQPLSL